MEKNIAVIWGDCSSPEIVKQTLRVLDKVAEKYGHSFHYTDAAMGGEAIDKYGDPLPQHELDKCLAADSVLLGAVGGPKWEGLPGEQRPEKGLLRLRAGMGLYSNNRPAKIWPQLAPASPLKPEIVAKGIDFIRPPSAMIFWMNGGKGSAWKVLPVVSSVMTPVSKFTLTVSPALMASTASGHSIMGRPRLMLLR